MALIRGARGLIYFVHQFKPAFREAALLDDPEMLAAVTDLNREIRELVPALNGPTIENRLTVQSSDSPERVAALVKRYGDTVYIFAVNLLNHPASATFTLRQMDSSTEAEVLAESRRVPIHGEQFADEFASYAVHLYRISR